MKIGVWNLVYYKEKYRRAGIPNYEEKLVNVGYIWG